MKKILTVSATMLMLSSCVLWEGDGRNPDESDPNVLSVDINNKVSVSQLYDGYEELQGKKIGNIKMPEKIEPVTVSEMYTFKLEENVSTEDAESRGKEVFKRFFGDAYNDELILHIDGENGIHYNAPTIEDTGHYDPNIGDYGYYNGYPGKLLKSRTRLNSNENIVSVLDPEKDANTKLRLNDGECTVSELCKTVQNFTDSEVSGFEGLKISPVMLAYYKENESFRAHIKCAAELNGIPLLYWFTSYTESTADPKGETETYYSPLMMFAELDSKDDIVYFSMDSPPCKVTGLEKQDEFISLKQAAELVGSQLAVNIHISFEKVSLMYCRKVRSYHYAEELEKPFEERTPAEFTDCRPTWVFEWNTQKGALASQSIKVDALSGEITIDADEKELNKMYVEQNRKRPNN